MTIWNVLKGLLLVILSPFIIMMGVALFMLIGPVGIIILLLIIIAFRRK